MTGAPSLFASRLGFKQSGASQANVATKKTPTVVRAFNVVTKPVGKEVKKRAAQL
jgi:hypothetical protein